MTEPAANASERSCQWCAEVSPATATQCRACGAALVLHDSIGEMVIPGVTDVDPNLKIYANKPLRIPHGSPAQGLAGGAIGAAAMLGGPAGLVALGGLAAVGVSEWRRANGGRNAGSPDADRWGEPSEPVREMAKRLTDEAVAGEEVPPPAEPGAAGD